MDSKDICISFDVTGSMASCLGQVRKNVEKFVKTLFETVPNVRVCIIAHSDYCDAKTIFLTKMLDFSEDREKICHFIRNVENGYGGDAPEAYEFVLNQVRSASWKSGTSKSLIMIGDDVPHPPTDPQNFKKLDWKNEARLLSESGIKIYSVQALGRDRATSFWKGLAEITDGYHLSLNQFADIEKLILAVGHQQISNDQLISYENELIVNGQMNKSIDGIISTMLRRAPSKKYEYSASSYSSKYSLSELKPVSSGRFQVLDVPYDIAIKDFVLLNGVEFKIGRGFYQFTKRVTVQDHKEIILRDKLTGDFFTGDSARHLAGIPVGVTAKVSPENLPKFEVFIQSTSVNRKLLGGTKFLYEISDWLD